MGFPISEITYRITERLASSLRIAPNGNEWYVKDRSLQQHSQLAHEAYVLEWRFNWRAHEHFMLTASVGREFHSRYELTLQDESQRPTLQRSGHLVSAWQWHGYFDSARPRNNTDPRIAQVITSTFYYS